MVRPVLRVVATETALVLADEILAFDELVAERRKAGWFKVPAEDLARLVALAKQAKEMKQ